MSKKNKENECDDYPSTNQDTFDGKWFGFSSMQGRRASMEDCHQHLIHLDDDHHAWKKYSYFAIFDGHSGIGTAQNASEYLHIHLKEEFQRIIDQKENYLTYQHQNSNENVSTKQIRRATKRAFIKLDENLREMDDDHSGSVCIAAIITRTNIYLANLGDARGIIISNHGQVLQSTHDHKPDDPNEQKRIYEAGGHITRKSPKDCLRVEHRLAVTRVLGDFALDKNVVPPLADIITYPRKSSASYVILASDGIWNVMSNEDVAKFVSERIQSWRLEAIASQLLDHCFENKGRDNMSVYIIQL